MPPATTPTSEPTDAPLPDPRLERTYVGIFEGLLHDAEAEALAAARPGTPAEETLTGAEPLPGSDVFGDPSSTELVVSHEIGRGGTGVVFAAQQRCLSRTVAVKTLHPELARGPALARFEEEASVLGRLEHPCIVPVYAFGRDARGRPFLAMREAKGLPWSGLLRPTNGEERARAARLGLRGHVDVLLRVAEAVAFAHDKGIAHRDLKPTNVIVGDFGEVQLIDWGHAAEQEDRSDDMLQLGGLLQDVLAATQGGETSAGLEEIALRATSTDPDARFATAEEFASAVEAYFQQEASTRLSTSALQSLISAERDAKADARPPSRIYAALAEASADLERSLELWPGNRSAAQGLARAPLATAAYALEKGDLGAAEAQLDRLPPGAPAVSGLPAPDELRRRLASLRESRARERQRTRLLVLVLALAAVVAVAAGVQLGLGRKRVERAVAASEARQRALAAVEGATWKESQDQAALFRAALAIDPTWMEGWVNLAAAHLARAEEVSARDAGAAAAAIEEARAALDSCLASAPDAAAALLGRARCLLLLGRETAAREDLARASRGVEREDAPHAALAAAATLALLEGRAADAEALSDRAAALSRDVEDFTRRAVARYVQGKLALGLADVRVARSLAPTRRSLDGLLALFEAALGDERAAGRTLVRGARASPSRPGGLGLLAYLAARRGDADAARALAAEDRGERSPLARRDLDVVVLALPGAEGALGALGRAYVGALDLSAVAPRAATETSARLRARGRERLAAGDLQGALALAERAIALDPADGEARLLSGRALFALGGAEPARHEFGLVATLAPELAATARRSAAEADAWRLATPTPPAEGGR